MDTHAYSELSDRELIDQTVRAAGNERGATAALIALLSELDFRRLYLAEGCSSLFTYCTQVLHLSEHAAYHRIEAARAARRFPRILGMLAEGAVTLTTVALLRPHLTADSQEALLDAARHQSKREVEHQIACLAPRPDARTLVRRIAAPGVAALASPEASVPTPSPTLALEPIALHAAPVEAGAVANPTRPVVSPLSSERYLLKVTLSREAHSKLRRAQDLLRHTVPNGDPAAIVDRALTTLVEHLERVKLAAAKRSRSTRGATPPLSQQTSRYIAAAVKRSVWARDQGQCAFAGARGRCRETGQLEFHHVIPFAAGGPTTVENLSLRCRAHNGYESETRFGRWDDPVIACRRAIV